MEDFKAACKIVVDELFKEDGCGLFQGKYDATNGDAHFMYGISTLLEHLAYSVSEEYGDAISDMFTKNMVESEGEPQMKELIEELEEILVEYEEYLDRTVWYGIFSGDDYFQMEQLKNRYTEIFKELKQKIDLH